jgi:hypothetical protein
MTLILAAGADCAREQNSSNPMTCTIVMSGHLVPQ